MVPDTCSVATLYVLPSVVYVFAPSKPDSFVRTQRGIRRSDAGTSNKR